MGSQSFKHALGDCFHRAMDLLSKDKQLDVIYGMTSEHIHDKTVLRDIVTTHQTLPTKTYRKAAVEDQEVLEMVHKLETYENPIIVLTFK